MISFAVVVIVRIGSGGFRGGMPKAADVEGKGRETGKVGGMIGVGSEEEVPAETKAEMVEAEMKAGAVAQTRSSYNGGLQDPGMSIEIGSGVRSQGSLIESGVLGSGRTMSSSIREGVCHSSSESMIA